MSDEEELERMCTVYAHSRLISKERFCELFLTVLKCNNALRKINRIGDELHQVQKTYRSVFYNEKRAEQQIKAIHKEMEMIAEQIQKDVKSIPFIVCGKRTLCPKRMKSI